MNKIITEMDKITMEEVREDLMNWGVKLLPDEIIKVVKLAKRGMYVKDIAKLFHMSPITIRKYIPDEMVKIHIKKRKKCKYCYKVFLTRSASHKFCTILCRKLAKK